MRVVLLALLVVSFALAVSARSPVANAVSKFCNAHCTEACNRLKVPVEYKSRCQTACQFSCDHKNNMHVMSDARFFKKLKKIGKKIGGAIKKVGKVVKKVKNVVSKVTSLPGKLVTKVVNKLPLPKGLKKVLNVIAPIAIGSAFGGIGGLGGLKSLGAVGKAINAVKNSKIVTAAMKVKKTFDNIKGKVNAVRGLVKGKLTGIKDLVKGKLGNVEGLLKGKAKEIVGKLKNTKIYKTYEKVKGKVNEVKGKINNVVGKVKNFKNKALGKLDKFGPIGGMIKDQINGKISEVTQAVKDKVKAKVANLKEKAMKKLKLDKVRDAVNKVKGKIQNIKDKAREFEGRFDAVVQRLADDAL